MATETENCAVPATTVTGPSCAEILEFARRSKAINLDVTVGTLLENLSVVEPRLAAGPGAQLAGFGIVTGGFGIVNNAR